MLILGKENPYEGKEKYLQVSVINYLRMMNYFCIHVPNGGSRNSIEAKNLKKQGVLPGCPDILIFEGIKLIKNEVYTFYPLCVIELKVKGGKLSDYQDVFLKKLEQKGYLVIICYSLTSLIESGIFRKN